MHHDFFAWVRLFLLVILIMVFGFWCNLMEAPIQQEQQKRPEPVQKEPIYVTQVTATAPTINHTEAETAPEPTFSKPLEVTTPPTEAATIAAEPPTEPEPIPTETAYPYTDKDLEHLALVIYQEAGGDMYSDETRLMVGTVVMNRVADDRFPDTILDVILQRGQYGRLFWTGPMWPARRWEAVEAHAVERAYTIAERILNGERALPADVIFQSEYIQGEIVAHQGGFYFCR